MVARLGAGWDESCTMDYSSRGSQHLNYTRALSEQLAQLSLSQAGPSDAIYEGGRGSSGMLGRRHHYNTGYLKVQEREQQQLHSHQHTQHYQQQLPSHQVQEAEQLQQQHLRHHQHHTQHHQHHTQHHQYQQMQDREQQQLFLQQNQEPMSYPSSVSIKSHSYLTPRQQQSPAQRDFTPKILTTLSLSSPESTAPIHSHTANPHTHSLTSSPMRSMLVETTLTDSLTPRAEQCVGVSVSSQPQRQDRMEGVHLASSLPSQLASSLPSQQQSPALPYTPGQLPLQDGMRSTQLGLTWNPSTNSHVQGYTQLHTGATQQTQHTSGSLNMLEVSQYASQSILNGQMSHSMHMQQGFQPHFPSQIQYSSVDYSGAQQQQYNFNQLQSFPQTSGNNQFNTDYVENPDPSMYQDYYYGDYQYNDSYSSLEENFLDVHQLNTSALRATTPYGDETVEELGPEEVRWFYKVEADKKWTPFIGYDSLRIEWKYRDLLQDVGSEEKENSASKQQWGANISPREKQESSSQDVGRIVVRGGLYEVDVKQHKCESIYWQGEVFIITRGTWFYDTWGPLEEQLADHIEVEHLAHFRGHLLSSQRLDDSTKQVVHSLSLNEGDVEWFNASEVYMSSDATPSRLMRSVGKKLGFQKTGYKLHRGYSIDATSSDKPPDINHIVFVIHGIGQKMERGRIIKNCTGLRENVNYLKQKYYPSMSKSSHTVEFFPVEWRSSLVLDAGVIDSITPQKILNIRQMLNASFMDIMYYNSPLYREEIISGLTNEMNRLYTMFTQRNPYFEANKGKVSMVAHSLGCVITYDIVTGWNPAHQFDHQFVQSLIKTLDMNKKFGNDSSISLRKGLHELISKHDFSHSQPSLNFKIENFFCLGSPLAVFLALRTKNSQVEATDIIPQKLCKRLLNIFHPADPVAYRIEPLLCPEYSSISPVLIHSYNAAEKIPYNEMPLDPIVMVTRDKDKDYKETGDKSRADSGNNTPASSVPSTPVKGGTSSWSLWGLMKGNKKSAEAGYSNQDVTSVLQEGKSLTERMDFVLREGSMESSYISAVTSHTSYWTNYDVSDFILSVLYPDLQPATTTSKSETSQP